MQQKVDAFIAKHRNTPISELCQQKEFQEVFQVFEDFEPENPARIDEVVRSIAVIKDAEDRHGSLNLSLDKLDSAQRRAFLEAVFSGEKERMNALFTDLIEAAIIEFALDPDLEKTTDGVIVTMEPK